MESVKRIHDTLLQVFQRQRLVFWYDPDHQWFEVFDTFQQEGIRKIKVDGTEFGTKVAIHRNPDPQACYLLYFPSERPNDADNWLLDLLLQGHEYKADRASLALQEVGLPYDFRPLASEHVGFFKGEKRLQAFRDMITSDEDAATLRLKMMSVLLNTDPDIDALTLEFLRRSANETMLDPIQEKFGSSMLVDHFWKEVGIAFGYTDDQPTLRDFVTTLFRWDSPLDTGIKLDPHAKVFLQRWKDSQNHGASFREWSEILENDLHVEEALNELDAISSVEDADTYPLFEKFILSKLCEAFNQGGNGTGLLATIQNRRGSFWFKDHQHGYEALEQAILFRELIATAELAIDSINAGISRYTSSWHRIDTAYRRFNYSLRKYGQVALMERITEWVEKTYVNNFLLPLSDLWGDQVRTMTEWRSDQLPAQEDFFKLYVQPFLDKKQKVVVVISDALRYAAAAELTSRLRADNRWTAELEALLGVLPSYTQLGMASLLPGHERTIEPKDGSVMLDGRSTSGVANRSQILSVALDGKAKAIKAEEFLEMNSKNDVRPLFKEYDAVFIYHDVIDKIGHERETEVKTSSAVEEAFDELQKIFKKIANANRDNMLLTADHGFLFQQSPVEKADDQPLPKVGEMLKTDRRFVLGKDIQTDPAIKNFTASQLNISGDWSAAFPLGLGRFPLRGSGKRFVHGGLSLQEIIIPVVRIHKTRVDDTGQVDVEVLRLPTKITTGQLSLAFYQDRPVADKVLPRTLRVGVFAKDGTALSESRAIGFDSGNEDPRHREKSLVLVLSRTADDYNNQEVEIRLEETIAGTKQAAVYKSYRVKLQKPFAGDFDDF